MTSKRILILANSTKHHPMRCVAGRELLEDGTGGPKWGGWVRPVSNHDEGALAFFERRLTNATEPRPLEIVQIHLRDLENNPMQPENWLIEESLPWSKDRSIDAKSVLPLVEEPFNLWLDPAQKKNDRARASALQGLPNFQSLYLIRPDAFHFNIRSTTWEGGPKKQQRGQFLYRGRDYDFAVTDPLIGQKYFPDYPRMPDGIIEPDGPGPILLCVSLTPPFQELHYKVIATVLELAA